MKDFSFSLLDRSNATLRTPFGPVMSLAATRSKGAKLMQRLMLMDFWLGVTVNAICASCASVVQMQIRHACSQW